MVQVVGEASLHYGLVRLLGQHDGVLIVTVEFNLFNGFVLGAGLELISIENSGDVRFFLGTLIDASLDVVFGRSDKWVNLVKVFFLIEKDSSLKDLILTGRDIGDTRVDHHFLLVVVDILQWIRRLDRIEVVSVDFIVDLNLLLFVLGRPAHDRVCDCGSLIVTRRLECCVLLGS